MSEKLETPSVATATVAIELEELQAVIAEGQERGFVSASVLAAALEEAELASGQPHDVVSQDVLSYLEEHGIEVLAAADPANELSSRADPAEHTAALAQQSSDTLEDAAEETDADSSGEEQVRGLQARA